jgi:hypothetical protein
MQETVFQECRKPYCKNAGNRIARMQETVLQECRRAVMQKFENDTGIV